MDQPHRGRTSALRRFLHDQTSAGLVLLAAALAALVIANSPLLPTYEALLHATLGPLSLGHWINDAAMALFFLLVGLEIKREAVEGRLSTWRRRVLPGIAAVGGMVVPAAVYLLLNRGSTAVGWAIPAATDIAFALGVVALLGKRVPTSLKLFLTALAIIDDLGAVAIIALFYTSALSLTALAGAVVVTGALTAMNLLGVRILAPYLLLGVALWVLVLVSGIHPTLAGVVLAFTVPLRPRRGLPTTAALNPLHRLENALHLPVSFLVVPLFALANAGLAVLQLPAAAFAAPVTLGTALGLLLGKVGGVYGFAALAIRSRLAEMPTRAGRSQLAGIALLCGIGFTMSIFITLLAFPADAALQAQAKLGVLTGSALAGLGGYAVLRWASQPETRHN